MKTLPSFSGKVAMTLILTMLVGLTLAQSGRKIQPLTCEEEVARANADADKGVLKLTKHGLVSFADGIEFVEFRDNYLFSIYGVIPAYPGCIILDNEECYSDQMYKRILAKYGADFFERFEQEVQKEFGLFQTMTTDQRKRYVNFNAVYCRPHDKPHYSEGIETFREQIAARMDSLSLPWVANKRVIGAWLVIDESGAIESCKILPADCPEDESEKIQAVIKEMGKWVPGKVFGFDVKSELTIAIHTNF